MNERTRRVDYKLATWGFFFPSLYYYRCWTTTTIVLIIRWTAPCRCPLAWPPGSIDTGPDWMKLVVWRNWDGPYCAKDEGNYNTISRFVDSVHERRREVVVILSILLLLSVTSSHVVVCGADHVTYLWIYWALMWIASVAMDLFAD